MRVKTLFLMASLALLASALVAPGVAAQGTTTIDNDGKQATISPANIRPGADSADVSIPFNVKFGTQAQSLAGAASSTITVKATPKNCSPYIQIVGTTDATISVSPAEASSATGKSGAIVFKIVLKPDAPGLESLQCSFDVQAQQGVNTQAQPASNTMTTSITVKGTYIALIQANVANGKLKTTGPQKEVPYQLELTNFGNAKTVVNFAITNEPSGGKWEALAPEQVTLNTEQSGLGNKQTIPFIVSTTYKNGWNNAVGGYTLELTPSAFIDAEQKGTPTQVNVLARVRGVYVPGVEPFVLVAAVLGAALVARLARDE